MTLPLHISVPGGRFLGGDYRSDFRLAIALAGTIAPGAPWWRFFTIEGDPQSKSA